MYGQLNPHQIQDIATELTSHEQLIILQDEFTGLQAELAQTQKNARAKEDNRKVARVINKLCMKLSVAVEQHRMFTQEYETSLGWVIIKQKTSEFLLELAKRDDERVRQLQAIVRETEERADEKMVFIEKLKGNTPF
ncbi:hypothetical protein Tco_1537647 [Tanacetum coccineum]